MIETQRLTLTPWDVAGLEAFMRVTNTPEVMEFLGGVQSRDRFEAFLGRLQASQRDNGFCLWLARRKADAVLGFCGLKRGSVGPIDGKIEIGWRLGREFWGQGYAREGAEASLAWAWANLSCDRIFAITAVGNVKSRKLMERLGLTRRAELDFLHPAFAPDHALAAHVTYAIARPD